MVEPSTIETLHGVVRSKVIASGKVILIWVPPKTVKACVGVKVIL